MYRNVIAVDGKGYDSVYALIKDHKIVVGPAYLYNHYVSRMKVGDKITVTLDQFVHFRNCSEMCKVDLEIEKLEDF